MCAECGPRPPTPTCVGPARWTSRRASRAARTSGCSKLFYASKEDGGEQATGVTDRPVAGQFSLFLPWPRLEDGRGVRPCVQDRPLRLRRLHIVVLHDLTNAFACAGCDDMARGIYEHLMPPFEGQLFEQPQCVHPAPGGGLGHPDDAPGGVADRDVGVALSVPAGLQGGGRGVERQDVAHLRHVPRQEGGASPPSPAT